MNELGRSRPPWWAWPSVLAVDAPVVAVAWAWALARAAGVSFTAADAVAIAAGTAGVYLADRVRDARRLGGTRAPTWRHASAAARPRTVAVAAATCLALTAATAPLLAPASVAWGAAVAAGAAALLVAARRGRGTGRAAWRPFAVGAVFAAGVALPVAAGGLQALARVGPALAGLAAVATLNVAMIAAWERRLDDGAIPAGPATGTGAPSEVDPASTADPAAATRRVRVTAGVTLAGLLLAASVAPARGAAIGLTPALALGAALLVALDLLAPSAPDAAQAEAWHLAADAALLVALAIVPLG